MKLKHILAARCQRTHIWRLTELNMCSIILLRGRGVMQKFFTILMFEGQVDATMSLDACSFSPKFGWAQDRFGVSQQLTQVSV